MADVELIPGKKYAPAQLGHVLIVGLGKSGQAAVRYCLDLLGSRVSAITVSAGKRNPAAEAFAAELEGADIDFRFEYEDIQGHFDLCIISPGISDLSDLYKRAAAVSDEILSELEFAWRESDADSIWVAISGTNGKTTTTSLITHLFKAAGKRAAAVGNIGEVALGVVAHAPVDVYCAEVSSFQLATMSRFAPEAAVLLNITPDHITWHGSMERYIEAKAQLLTALERSAACGKPVAVLDCTNDIVAALAAERPSLGESVAAIRLADAPAANAAYVNAEGRLAVAFPEEAALCAVEDLQIKGEHNVLNALAAASAALAMGVPAEVVIAGLKSFAPLHHRIEPCGSARGISYFNDSKGTNVDATLKAFTAFAPRTAICLLGGTDKGTDLAPLVEAAQEKLKAVVCYGASRPRFLEAFGVAADAPEGAQFHVGEIDVLVASGMRDAARAASVYASAGDCVLLSPACASFDEFTGYDQRGNVFKDLVRQEFCGDDC